MTAYVPALVCEAEPPVTIEEVAPGTEPDTVAACAEASYVTGEFVTDKVGVALLIMKFPADAAVREL